MAQMFPGSITHAELESLAAMHGGHVKGGQEAAPADPVAEARAAARGLPVATARKTKFRFEDGTSIELTWSQEAGKWIVADPVAATRTFITGSTAAGSTSAEMDAAQLEGQRLLNEERRLSIQQAQNPKPVTNSLEAAYRDLDSTLDYLAKQRAAGKITWEQMQAEANRAKAAFSDQLAGSTAYQRAQQGIERGQIGASMLNQRVSSGTSLANSLYQGANDLFAGGKIAAGSVVGNPYAFNPFRLAKNFVTDLGGGQETYNAAASMVQGAGSGATQGSGYPDTIPAYWFPTPENPGDPPIPDQFDQDDNVDEYQPYQGGFRPYG